MSTEQLRRIVARIRALGREAQAIANEIEAQSGHLHVNLPRDLFSDLEGKQQTDTVDCNGRPVEMPEELPRRSYRKNPCPMREHLEVSTSDKLGKAQGFCARNDIERSVARITGRSREDVRDAVNRVAELMQITCVKSNSYRYYPISRRRDIVDMAVDILGNQ